MPQISASVEKGTIEVINDIAKEEERTFSSMVNIILTVAAVEWVQNKSKKPTKKQTSKSKKP